MGRSKGSRYSSYRSLSKPRKKRVSVTSQDESDEVGPSASAKQLKSASSESIAVNVTHCYRIIQFAMVFNAISDKMVCRNCKKTVTFAESDCRGFGFKIVLKCRCGREDIPLCLSINNGYEVNRGIVFVMKLLDISREGLNLFSGLMDIGGGLSIVGYTSILQHIYDAAKVAFLTLTRKAVAEEKEEKRTRNLPEDELIVSGDGSWKKRGFNSLYGVTSIIGNLTGNVIGCAVKGAFCQSCSLKRVQTTESEFEEWFQTHSDECTANHQGSAGKMEVDSVVEMFSQSEEKYQVRYRNYVGDGDSKTYKAVVDSEPYGPDFEIFIKEDIGHVAKRMGVDCEI